MGEGAPAPDLRPSPARRPSGVRLSAGLRGGKGRGGCSSSVARVTESAQSFRRRCTTGCRGRRQGPRARRSDGAAVGAHAATGAPSCRRTRRSRPLAAKCEPLDARPWLAKVRNGMPSAGARAQKTKREWWWAGAYVLHRLERKKMKCLTSRIVSFSSNP